MEQEELAILNVIATAEGAIELIIHHTNRNLQGSKILILGFGRIGKILAQKLKALDSKVTCAARKQEDLAWITAYGYQETNINQLGENLAQYDIIINTVPKIILTKEKLKQIKKETLLLELASNPGGMDKKEIEKTKRNYILGLGLPGKVAPLASAEIIKNTIYHITKEEKECS